MAWTDPNLVNWDVGEPLTAADMQTYVRDNLLALRSLNLEQTTYKLSSDISTNSTSFVDADPTNLQVSIDTTSDRLLCICVFRGTKDTAGLGYFDLIVNKDTSTDVRAGDVNNGLLELNTATASTHTMVGFWTGLDAGTKTVKLQLKSSDTNNVSILNRVSVTLRGQFGIRAKRSHASH